MSAERIVNVKAIPLAPVDISDYENMSKKELIRELVQAKINEARAKKATR